jgi:hypothetical protein
MMRKLLLVAAAPAVLSLSLLVVIGCGRSGDGPEPQGDDKSPRANAKAVDPTKEKAADKKAEEHGHKPGAHGGIMVTIGRDSYHAEAVFQKGGVLRLYMLGADESQVYEIDAQKLTGYAKLEGGADSEEFELNPTPQAGDSQGKTSQFLGRLPSDLWGKSVEVTIPSIRINGERFRIAFKSVNEKHAEEMPASDLSAEQEKKLYLTPGGKYTEADIQANGNQTASAKFRGFQAKHDLKPKAGDKVCPVTLTKANPACAWVVGGKTYEFCCPPCVEEFVIQAKTAPQEIKEPGDYVKK